MKLTPPMLAGQYLPFRTEQGSGPDWRQIAPHNLKRGSRSMTEVSTFRLYIMRLLYLLNFVLLGMSVWPGLINHGKPWDPMHGIAVSFWGALSALSGLGIRYPLKMLPLLIMQMSYKSIWLLAVYLPLRSADHLDSVATELFSVCAIGLVVDLIVIPWPYVLANYVRKPGERWR
jgi:hypothetical protein